MLWCDTKAKKKIIEKKTTSVKIALDADMIFGIVWFVTTTKFQILISGLTAFNFFSAAVAAKKKENNSVTYRKTREQKIMQREKKSIFCFLASLVMMTSNYHHQFLMTHTYTITAKQNKKKVLSIYSFSKHCESRFPNPSAPPPIAPTDVFFFS